MRVDARVFIDFCCLLWSLYAGEREYDILVDLLVDDKRKAVTN